MLGILTLFWFSIIVVVHEFDTYFAKKSDLGEFAIEWAPKSLLTLARMGRPTLFEYCSRWLCSYGRIRVMVRLKSRQVLLSV